MSQNSDNTVYGTFDEALALSYVGKYVLVGVSYVDEEGREKSRLQMHGVIESADGETGMRISLRGKNAGQVWTMPPDLRSMRAAEPGDYTLKATGERISDPDLICTWIVRDT